MRLNDLYFIPLYSVPSAVDCGDPGTPTNGHLNFSSATYNSVVTYTCDVGYTLQGSNSRTCQSNGEWSGRVPQCNGMLAMHQLWDFSCNTISCNMLKQCPLSNRAHSQCPLGIDTACSTSTTIFPSLNNLHTIQASSTHPLHLPLLSPPHDLSHSPPTCKYISTPPVMTCSSSYSHSDNCYQQLPLICCHTDVHAAASYIVVS